MKKIILLCYICQTINASFASEQKRRKELLLQPAVEILTEEAHQKNYKAQKCAHAILLNAAESRRTLQLPSEEKFFNDLKNAKFHGNAAKIAADFADYYLPDDQQEAIYEIANLLNKSHIDDFEDTMIVAKIIFDCAHRPIVIFS